MKDLIMTLTRLSNYAIPSFPSLLGNFFEGKLMDRNNRNFAGTNSSLPAVNVKESNDEFLIDVAAPGLKKNDFKLSYDNGMLTISSEKSENKEQKDGGVITRKEFSHQPFQRSFNMPEGIVNADKISAKYENGILYVVLPKCEEVKPKPVRKIKIL